MKHRRPSDQYGDDVTFVASAFMILRGMLRCHRTRSRGSSRSLIFRGDAREDSVSLLEDEMMSFWGRFGGRSIFKVEKRIQGSRSFYGEMKEEVDFMYKKKFHTREEQFIVLVDYC